MVDISVFLEIWKTHRLPGLLSVLGLALSASVFTSVAIAGLIDFARKKEVGANLIKILVTSLVLSALSACTTYYFVLVPEGQPPPPGPAAEAIDRLAKAEKEMMDKVEELLAGRWTVQGLDCSEALAFEVDRRNRSLVLSTQDGIHTSYSISSVHQQAVRVSYPSGEELSFVRKGDQVQEVSSNGQSRSYRRCEA